MCGERVTNIAGLIFISCALLAAVAFLVVTAVNAQMLTTGDLTGTVAI